MDAERLARETHQLLARVEAADLASRIQVRFNPRMRTRAGACSYNRIRHDHVPGRFAIDLNPTLLLDRHPEALLPTLAHEIAHAVVRAQHGGRASTHGPAWKTVMSMAPNGPMATMTTNARMVPGTVL